MNLYKKDFVSIVKCFEDPEQRTLNVLKKHYFEIENIKKYIYRALYTNNSIDNNYSELFSNKSVLIKPNWVRHPLKETDEICLVTHQNFILAAIEIILEQKPKKIIIGDAPIQGCNWQKMIGDNFLNKIANYSHYFSVPISIKDFRRTISNNDLDVVDKNIHQISDYKIFNLEKDSYLEPISSKRAIFRVTDYDPVRLATSHSIGRHKYCIIKEIFDNDIILSLPKLKTHQKTGITCALKNLVGLNGDKDFLPHHRVGGTESGGDCYPGKNYIRRIAEIFLDKANKNIGKKEYLYFKFLSKLLWKLNRETSYHHIGAGWHGNDTTWRMVLDLNRIAEYGNQDGTLSSKPIRRIFSLCDGIIAGQGNGPLYPEPLPMGIVSFTNKSALNDAAMAILMNFDINKIPLIRESLSEIEINNCFIYLDGKKIQLESLFNYKLETLPPPGWVGYIESM